jgi:hypothetical protein
MLTQPEKCNSIVIIPIQQYESKIHYFLQMNSLQTTSTDPSKRCQTQIRTTINKSKTLIPQYFRWKYINLNPSVPTIRGLIKKIHKPDQPIRNIVNWHNAPACKLAKLFTQRISQLAPLPYNYITENSKDLIQRQKDTPIIPHFTFASLHITNSYPNIPVTETKEI